MCEMIEMASSSSSEKMSYIDEALSIISELSDVEEPCQYHNYTELEGSSAEMWTHSKRTIDSISTEHLTKKQRLTEGGLVKPCENIITDFQDTFVAFCPLPTQSPTFQLTRSEHSKETSVSFEREKISTSKVEQSKQDNLMNLIRAAEFNIPKRTKWETDEVNTLWRAIATHGSSWGLIQKNFLKSRTYHQIKDKARRLLVKEGWISSPSKHGYNASDANEIALRVIARGLKSEEQL